MLRSVQDVYKLSILDNPVYARDGEFGMVAGLLFDDQNWAVRYLVVAAGDRHEGHMVLIVPEHVDSVDARSRVLQLSLDREAAAKAPGIDNHPPAIGYEELAWLRAHEANGAGIPLWPAGRMAADMFPAIPESYIIDATPEGDVAAQDGAHHLRSTDKITGYRIRAADGEAGHVEAFLVDDAEWRIRYLAIDIRNWLPAKKVLLPARLVSRISWATETVGALVGKDAIRQAPEWDALRPMDRGYEAALHEHYRHAIGESV